MHQDGDPDQSQNVMGSTFAKDPSSDFFHDVPTVSICVILLTKKYTNRNTDGHENHNSSAELTKHSLLLFPNPISKNCGNRLKTEFILNIIMAQN